MKTTLRSFAKAVCVSAILLIVESASAQTFDTVSYTGGNLYQISPGGVATTLASGFSFPTDLALNSSGDLFVASSANNQGGNQGYITKIAPGGAQSTFASGIDPQAITFSSSGNLYEADYLSGNIYEFAPNGTRSTFASGFTDPISLTFDSSGNLFVGSGYGANNGLITKVTPGGVQSTFASGLYFPLGLEFDSTGNNLYETDNGSDNIYKFTLGGARSTFATLTSQPAKFVFDSAGDMFVTTSTGNIDKITPGGTQSVFASVGGGSLNGIIIVPEPSISGFIGAGALVFLLYGRCKKSFSATSHR